MNRLNGGATICGRMKVSTNLARRSGRKDRCGVVWRRTSVEGREKKDGREAKSVGRRRGLLYERLGRLGFANGYPEDILCESDCCGCWSRSPNHVGMLANALVPSCCMSFQLLNGEGACGEVEVHRVSVTCCCWSTCQMINPSAANSITHPPRLARGSLFVLKAQNCNLTEKHACWFRMLLQGEHMSERPKRTVWHFVANRL
ncbi:hypothetical protein A0H81_05994 [Grifola frondosa]|uniref:Uncharacterized protein n=1 Tax=Grifola frondosa TaxID=5627 RepID=A0A1C7M9I6_GRIFR|nr:hypothetical protein A0H81_05994 [Grifola frondosa]